MIARRMCASRHEKASRTGEGEGVRTDGYPRVKIIGKGDLEWSSQRVCVAANSYSDLLRVLVLLAHPQLPVYTMGARFGSVSILYAL